MPVPGPNPMVEGLRPSYRHAGPLFPWQEIERGREDELSMARIRSVHPGLFTDEAFMQASAHARLLLIGIWTEAFDDGVFEWKPITLKAKIFPNDNVDVRALLVELTELDFIKAFDGDGKPYGAIRNFQKWQRPKKPNSSGSLPNSLHQYVGKVPHQYRTDGEIDDQMEDGGGNKEEESATASLRSAAAGGQPPLDLRRLCEESAGRKYDKGFSKIVALAEAGMSVEERILPMIRTVAADLKREGLNVGSWGYFASAIADETREPVEPPAPTPELIWCAEDSPEFAAGNRARVRRGERPHRAIPFPSRGGAKGIAHDARDLAGMEGGAP